MTAGAAGGGGSGRGYDTGLYVGSPNPMGSLSSNQVNAYTVSSALAAGLSPVISLVVNFSGAVPQNAWTSLSFTDNESNPQTFLSASASYSENSPTSGQTQWAFSFTPEYNPFTNGNVYALTFTYPTVSPPIVTSPTTLPNQFEGVPYVVVLTATNGTAPYQWSIVGTNPYFTLSPFGVLTMTGAPIGANTVTVEVTDSLGETSGPVVLTVNVLPAPPATLVNSMLTTTINSYLYEEYADDDDCQAFVDAYNEATQAYVTWFNSVSLPYYPGLTGPLLDWVGRGLYGLARTQLASPATGAQGPLNTIPLNFATFTPSTGIALNQLIPSSTTYYQTSDDLYQRILTWHFYKGDGKRFCMRWLKRRIMRFLAWPNGVDPPAVGPENTSAISCQVAGHVLTVAINQALLSNLLQITPGILTLFQIALEGGTLELPLQYSSVVVNIQINLAAVATPPTENSESGAASQTTGASLVTLTGGSGSYTYAWTWQSGGTGITITSPSAASTTFSASGLANGTGVSGVALCTVTDTVTTHTETATVTVGIERATAPAPTVAPASLSVSGANPAESTGSATVNVTGGVGPYTYAWTWQSGGTGITIALPNSASTTFSTSGLAPAGSVSGTAKCTVTDTYGSTGTVTIPISLSRVSLVTAAAAPSSLSVTGASATEGTANTTVTPSGGQAPYTYLWAWASGGSGITIDHTTLATTNFTGNGLTPGQVLSGVAQCTVKDAYGQTTTTNCSVSITRVSAVTTSVLPTSESISGLAATQTTGSATVTASGGGGGYTYAWSWSTGGANIAINSASAASTSFTGSGMTSGSTYTGSAKCTVTDIYGQTSSVTVSVSITRSSATQVFTNQAATVSTIPTGASQVVIEGWAAGGDGGTGTGNSTTGAGEGGGGSGAGGYFRKTLAITSASWGKTISISSLLTEVASLTISSGTFTIPTLTANKGANGGNATPDQPHGGSPGQPGSGGLGGTASGGDVNTTGGSGGPGGGLTGGAGTAGSPVIGVNGGPYGGGGIGGAFGNVPPGDGAPAGAVFKYS